VCRFKCRGSYEAVISACCLVSGVQRVKEWNGSK